jgi:hypothetical protein
MLFFDAPIVVSISRALIPRANHPVITIAFSGKPVGAPERERVCIIAGWNVWFTLAKYFVRMLLYFFMTQCATFPSRYESFLTKIVEEMG